MKKGAQIKNFRELPIESSRWRKFKFSGYRENLAHGKWPEKSVATAKYLCEYNRSDWKNSFSLNRFCKQRLEILDFPGERIADATIAAFKEYAGWSEHILNHFAEHHEYNQHLEAYLTALERLPVLTVDAVTAEYRLLLARLILSYKPLIVPSTFLLTQNGDTARAGSDAAIAGEQYAGLAFGLEFAPLPVRYLSENNELVDVFTVNYQKYRRELALPLFREISSANVLVILVDIPSLLAGGVDRYNDNRQILFDLFDAVRPDSRLGDLFSQLFGFFFGGLERVAFVATKMDMVRRTDIENGRLHGLLKEMTRRAEHLLPRVEFGWFACSACHSTKESARSDYLIGRLLMGNPGFDWVEYPVPELPSLWPQNWDYNEYPFYSILPNAPRNMQIPPLQNGLEKIFQFIAGD